MKNSRTVCSPNPVALHKSLIIVGTVPAEAKAAVKGFILIICSHVDVHKAQALTAFQ